MTAQKKPHPLLKVLPVMDLKDFSYAALNGADYHRHEIEELLLSDGFTTMWSENKTLDNETRRQLQRLINTFHWHLRAFFWELVATFDTLLMWAKYEYQLKLNGEELFEHKVKWFNVLKSQSQQPEWNNKLKIFENTLDSDWFYEVRKYRNFAHRAFLFGTAEYDDNFGRGEPSFEAFRLTPAREGQPYHDLTQQLRAYLEEMRQVAKSVFAT